MCGVRGNKSRLQKQRTHLPRQPQETLGGDVLLLLDLVDNESLQCLALAGLLDLAVADFLRAATALAS